MPARTCRTPGVVTTEYTTSEAAWSNRDAVVVVIVVVLADVATFRASCPVPTPSRKYVPTGMFGIPLDATVNVVLPTVDAPADAVAAAVPADQFEHAYRVLVAFGSLSSVFGVSGIPVFGVHADKPTNRVCEGDSFLMMHTGFTPVPDGDVNTAVGSGMVL